MCRCAACQGGCADHQQTAERSEHSCRRNSDHRVCSERLASSGGDVVSLRRTVTAATPSSAQRLFVYLSNRCVPCLVSSDSSVILSSKWSCNGFYVSPWLSELIRFLSHGTCWALLADDLRWPGFKSRLGREFWVGWTNGRYAMRLISRTGTEGPPVSSLNCDRCPPLKLRHYTVIEMCIIIIIIIIIILLLLL